jgi:DNA-binding transcriptional ArsR family regulator
MPRAATTADVFNAIAEPRRRDILGALTDGKPYPVGDVVRKLRMTQSAVSKHLSVLRRVGLVTVTKRGQMRLYQLNAEELKPVYDWVKPYEQFWTNQLDRIKLRAEQKAAAARKSLDLKPIKE